MQLHRASGNDWDKIEPENWTLWQRLAHATHGVVTPGNVITLLGALLVVIGLSIVTQKDHIWQAVALLMLGRLADLADGLVADWTCTKSPVGEALDAVVDKLEIIGVVIIIWLTSLIPDVVFAVFAFHAIYNGLLTIFDYFSSRRLHPSRLGKLAAAIQWVALGLFVMSAGLSLSNGQHLSIAIIGWVCFSVYLSLALISSAIYTAQLRGKYVATQ